MGLLVSNKIKGSSGFNVSEALVLDSTRNSVCRLTLIFIAIILLSTILHLKADSSLQPTVSLTLPDGGVADLKFSCQPALGICGDPTLSDGQSSWQCSDYTLQTEVSQLQGGYSLAFQLTRAGGASFELYDYGASVSVPYSQGDAVWSYNRLPTNDIMETDLENPLVYPVAPNSGIPFLVLADSSGASRLSMGLMSQDHRALIGGDLSGDSAGYTLSVKAIDDLRTNQIGDAFFISQTGDTWFHQAQAYTLAVDTRRGYVPLNIPHAASNSTYDSWYWTLDKIDQNLVWQLAQSSSALGFKSYLLDSGWDTRVGEYALGLNGSTGNYIPPVMSFSNFSRLLDDIRNKLGMRVMLWMQQYALGRRSVYNRQLAGAHVYQANSEIGRLQESLALCPSVRETGQHMAGLMDRIMDDYRPDGLWFDWQDFIPSVCSALHYHDFASFGEGYNSTQQVILDSVRLHNSNTFMEMRWPFANLNNKPYTQLWQPTDSPRDFEAMRLRAMNMRPFSSGVLMGTDEMYWDPTLSETDAARFMSTVVFTGVPYFGPNLIAAPPYQNEMLQAWLRFYEGHKKELIEGKFEPYGDPNHPDQVIEGTKETFIYYGNGYSSVCLTKPNNRIYIVNASHSPRIDINLTGLKSGGYNAVISDLYLQNWRTSRVWMFGDDGKLSIDLPAGYLLTLTRSNVKPSSGSTPVPSVKFGSYTKRNAA